MSRDVPAPRAVSRDVPASRLHTPAPAPRGGFRRRMQEEVAAGLSLTPRRIPSKYFYDETGSRLFDEITRLPEYYITRTETGIMRRNAREMAGVLGPGVLLVEFGSGSSAKTRILLDHLQDPAGYVPVDISRDYLEEVATGLRRQHPGLPVLPLAADFTGALTLPRPPRDPSRTVVYFPGSTIGNFPVLDAERLMTRMRRLAGPGGAVLLGFDRLKPRERLLAAYNDQAGVTARFNLNVLERLNRELGADFDVAAFRHDAPFNREASRIEMHLVSLRDQVVHLGEASYAIRAGERLVTEHSHKYALGEFAQLAEAAGLRACRSWSDPEALFTVQLLEPVEA